MFVHIPGVLTAQELAHCRARLTDAAWVHGRVTAGAHAARTKDNAQLAADSDAARELGDVVRGALERNAMFLSAALPRAVSAPLFNRYDPGMAVGAHTDNALRATDGRRMRTDLSATLFFSDSGSYDGGELVVEDGYARAPVKLPAGDVILYPAATVHRVTPVVRGTRLAAVFWVQSLVKDTAARSLLFDLDQATASLTQAVPDHPALTRIIGCYHNLVRRWCEI